MIINKKVLIKILVFIFVIGIIAIPRKLAKYEEDMTKKEEILADSSTPTLVTPFYNTNHFVVADYVLTSSGGDMTNAIQDALNKCSNNNGGTVWLERGIYKVSKTIKVPTNCTLMGDWQDPDNYQGSLDYGTKIVVDVNNFTADHSNNELSGLFRLQPSSGVEGLTIYYKNQNINSPKAQPWSFIYESGMLMSVKNVTMINSYNGIGRSIEIKGAHEMLMIENVKGTVLNKGVVIHNSSDVGTITGLSLTPKYLAKANLKAFDDNSSNPSESSISSAIKARGGVGMFITDAEQSQFVNITISGYKFGVQFPNAGLIKTRYMGSGSFYNLNVSDCDVGILADSGTYDGKTLIDFRWGYVITNSSIAGSTAAINNASSAVSGKRGAIKLNDVTIKGKVIGDAPVIYNNSGNSYAGISKNTDLTGKVNNSGKYSNLNLYRKLKNDGTNFTYLSAGSSVDQINNALSSISSKGGGVVYLKAGVYRIDKSINIPANVELRGTASSPSRYFKTGTTLNVVSNVRALRITGNNSGIYGLNIIYESNVNKLSKGSSYSSYDYSIFVEGVKNIYIKNVSIAAASHGIYLNKCENFAIENIVTGVIDNAIRIDNSSNGLIMNCLQNGTVICRNRLYSIDEGTANFNYIMNPNTKKKLRYIYLVGDSDIEIQNCFTYGSYVFFTANNSNVYSVNTGYDGGTGSFYEATNSNGVVINALKMDGTTVKRSGGSFGTYNAAKIWDINEKDTTANLFKVSKKYIAATIRPSSTSLSINANKEISYYYNGDGNVSCSSSSEVYAKCSVNVSKKTITITPVATTSSPVTIYLNSTRGAYYDSASSSISVSVSLSTSVKGDVDGNGKVGSSDYVLVRKHILKQTSLTGDKLKRADANNDGKVNSSDFVTIRKIIINGNSATPTPKPSTPTTVPKDTTPPTINSWESTSLKDTTVTSKTATTTICNLGDDVGDGLKTIEYYTNCTSTKTASISGRCATITIDACKNGTLYYRLKDNYNSSSLNTVNEIGKYLIFGQEYNKLLYIGSAASNNSSNISNYTNKCGTTISTCIKDIGKAVIKERANDSNKSFLENLYKGILGRGPDSSGLNSWLSQLDKGLARDKAFNSFVDSNEAKNIYAAWGYN